MSLSDFLEGMKIAHNRRIARIKEKSLQNVSIIMGVCADNVVMQFKTEYFIQSSRGKRVCLIHFNPYPDPQIMRKVLSNVSKKEYLLEFEKVLVAKMAQQGFTDLTLTETIFNAKEPVTLRVKW